MRGSVVLPGLLAAVLAVAGLSLVRQPADATAEAVTLAAGAPAGSTTQRVALVQEGTPAGSVQRSYLFTVPRGAAAPRPVVVALHGRNQSLESLREASGLEALGEREGFVSVFPSSYGAVWNAGTCCAPRRGTPMPDVAFLDQVLADVAERTPVDPRRVHVVGYSNGGMMAYRYACQRSSAVAGVGVVSGAMAASPDYADQGPQHCRPTSPVSVVAVHGAKDTTVPYDGGAVAGTGGGTVAPVRGGVDQSAVGAGCRSGASSRVGATVRLDYRECDGGAAVRLVKINGHGHGWTRDSRTYGYDTTAGLWAFLAPRRSGLAGGDAPPPRDRSGRPAETP